MHDKDGEGRRGWKRAVAPAAPPVSAAKEPSDLFANVEATAAGILDFFLRFVRTMLLAAFRPAKLAHHLASPEGAKVLVGPYTFICFVGFYAIKLLRRTLVFVLLVPFALLKSCDAETTSAIRWPSAWDIFTLPSLTDVLLIGLPLTGGIIAVAWVVWRVLARGNEALQSMFVRAVCYCIGLEFLLLLPLCAFLAAWVQDIDEREHGILARVFGYGEGVTYGFVAVAVALLVVWPAWSLYRVLATLRSGAIGPARLRFRVGAWLTCAFGAAVMMAFGMAMSYSSAKAEFEEKYKPAALLHVARVGPMVLASGNQVTFAIANNTGEARQFLLARSSLHLGTRRFALEPVAANAPFDAVYQLQPRERGWVRFKLGEDKDGGIAPAGTRLCLRELASRGAEQRICAFVGNADADKERGQNAADSTNAQSP